MNLLKWINHCYNQNTKVTQIEYVQLNQRRTLEFVRREIK